MDRVALAHRAVPHLAATAHLPVMETMNDLMAALYAMRWHLLIVSVVLGGMCLYLTPEREHRIAEAMERDEAERRARHARYNDMQDRAGR